MRIVVAPGAFKGTMTAAEAADRIAGSLAAEFPGAEIIAVPMADGGDGTVDVLLAQGARAVELDAADALGRPRRTTAARTDEGVVIELARTCGMHTIERPAPREATSLGLGLAMRAAIDAGAPRLVIALGGSASTDGGLGLLLALAGRDAGGGLAGLRRWLDAREDVTALLPGIPTPITVLADVDSPLTGPVGAALRFGPQKGLDGADAVDADALLGQWATVLGIDPATPGAGAAGGCGAALLALGAELVDGGAEIARIVGLEPTIVGADLVVTGEGRLDASTLAGKAPAAVARAARSLGVPCRIVAGSGDPAVAASLGADLVLLSDLPPAPPH